jgi:glycosyltransferase involved in cell wall biosynthesis
MFNNSKVCEKCINGNVLHVITNRCIRGSLGASALVAVESSIHKLLGLWRKNLDRIITPSHFYKEKLVEWGWPDDKLVYIPNYIDSSIFDPNYEPGNYYLYFGRLTKQKGVSTLIEAARKQKCRLLIAGTGPEEESLRAQAAGDNFIEFLGYCQGDHLHQLIRNARAVVLPSEWYENAPISLLEAYASGKPVIGAKIGGIPELIEDGVTGMIFESADIDSLQECLEKLETMPGDEIKKMGMNARRIVESTFTRKQYFKKMVELYESMLK